MRPSYGRARGRGGGVALGLEPREERVEIIGDPDGGSDLFLLWLRVWRWPTLDAVRQPAADQDLADWQG
jgi:hypothetical protein